MVLTPITADTSLLTVIMVAHAQKNPAHNTVSSGGSPRYLTHNATTTYFACLCGRSRSLPEQNSFAAECHWHTYHIRMAEVKFDFGKRNKRSRHIQSDTKGAKESALTL